MALGKITQIIGAVIDVEFPRDQIPKVYEALKLQDRLYALHVALFTDASPGPVKYALSRVRPGFNPVLRLPMVGPSDASRKAVDEALAHAGLI